MTKKYYTAPSLTVENIGSLYAQMQGELLVSGSNLQPGKHAPVHTQVVLPSDTTSVF